MIDNYLNESDKYFYGIINKKNDELYNDRFYNTINKAILSIKDILINNPPENIVVAIYRKDKQVLPSKYSCFNNSKLFKILKKSDNKLIQYANSILEDEKMFSRLSYSQIEELKNIINNFLDKNIDNTDWYEIGEFVEDIILTREQYTKYL